MQIAHAITEIDGAFLEVDDAFCDILRMPIREICRKSILEITYEPDRSNNSRMLYQLVNQGTTFVIRKRYKRSDGKLIKVENHVSRTLAPNGGSRLVASIKSVDNFQVEKVLEEPTTKRAMIQGHVDAIKSLLFQKRG